MFVTDADSFLTICKPSLASLAPGVEIVNLVKGENFVCPPATGVKSSTVA